MSVLDEAERIVSMHEKPSRRELLTLGSVACVATLMNAPRIAHATDTREQLDWSVLNVKSFGATGDGTTDDTAAFQRALDAAQRAGGGTVFAPPGHFLFKGSLDIHGGVTLRGSYGYVPSHPDIRDPKVVKPGDENSDHMVGTTPGLTHDAKWIRPGSD